MVRRYIITALVAPVLLSVCLCIIPADTAQGAAQCLTKSQARAKWPRDYLRYRLHRGQRCWSTNRRGHQPPRRVALASAGQAVQPAAPVPPPPTAPPLPPPLPPLITPRLELTADQWPVSLQVFASATPEPAEWDIWPPLPSRPALWVEAVPAVAVSWVLLLFGGVLVWRQRHQVA